jgi:predicted TIM-barrel fold metal-dependent hydrolase
MRIITIEEHMWTPALRERLSALPYEIAGPIPASPVPEMLLDTGERRLQHMDDMGVDMQVLSVTTPATQVLEPVDAVACAREANDLLGRVVSANPDRYQAFATLPTPDPERAADELERSVTELDLRGAMVHGRTGDRFLDHPSLSPVLERAEALGVPIYLHPQRPLAAVSDAYYSEGLPNNVAMAFSTFAWGWHVEAAVNAIRLIISGVFERTPGLQIILGHWGEMIPFFLERMDDMFGMFSGGQIAFTDTFLDHFHIAPSGIWSYRMLDYAMAAVGADRIVYSVDYPYQAPGDRYVRRFLEEAPISTPDKHKIGHQNIERLLGLK